VGCKSAATVKEAGLDSYKFSHVANRLVMRGSDVITVCDVLQTRVRRRAESKSLVRV
jgi:hypothetical protein